MHRQNFQELLFGQLGLIEMPSRYLGNEINAVRKDHSQTDLTVALTFPDLYEIGTSHFGMQILYTVLNNHPGIAAERFFTPAPDMAQHQKQLGIPCLSMESKQPLPAFDLIGISLLYELNFTNILTMLDLSGIPFLAADRTDCFPLIIGGGPCTFNPEPLADFFDAMVIGDGEEVIIEISETIIAFKQEGDGRKQTLLEMLSRIRGVYIPSFFNPVYSDDGLLQLIPAYGHYTGVTRAVLENLENAVFPTAPIVPFGKPVHDRLRLEVARGCSRGCRFCQAGMIYRPVRERSVDRLLDITQKSLENTGYRDISLLSLSTGDYSGLAALMQSLLELNTGHCHTISLPSIRAEKLTPQLMEMIRTVRKTGFTIAPEAGSQRLRDIINKNLSESSIEETVENAFKLGWKNIKLYFMMGLPFETPEDMEAICRLARRLASAKARGKKTIHVSIAPFIPKAHTPFERCAQIPLDRSKEYLQFLKDNLRHPKVNLKWQNPEMSVIEGVWSRGDRRLSRLLIAAFNAGCRLDGWSDHFNFGRWQDAFMKTGIDPDFYTTRERSDTEMLPWDHIDAGISRSFLKKEYEKAARQELTPDCRDQECSGCGICDFNTVQPLIHDTPPVREPLTVPSGDVNTDDFFKFEIIFSKTGPARFFGHLEMVNIIHRAIRRAGIRVRYSEGFNPNMKLAFDNPLPLGMESEAESFFLYAKKGTAPAALIQSLNARLPDGLTITDAAISSSKTSTEGAYGTTDHYRVRLTGGAIDPETIQEFLDLPELIMTDISSKGKERRVDLRQIVREIRIIDRQTIKIVINRNNQRTVRPGDILARGLGLPPAEVRTAVIRKLRQDR